VIKLKDGREEVTISGMSLQRLWKTKKKLLTIKTARLETDI
jgi:DNA-binding Xre family transcriptional regulator